MGNDYIARIYQRHVKMVYRLCYSFLGNANDAEDATQGVFMRLMRSPRRFEDVEHVKAWLIVCAQNFCRDVLKSSYHAKTSVESDEAVFDKAISDSGTQEQSDVEEAILRLPEKYKTCVYMYYYEGYRSHEIAQMINVPDSTVRGYLSEARRLLKEYLGSGGR